MGKFIKPFKGFLIACAAVLAAAAPVRADKKIQVLSGDGSVRLLSAGPLKLSKDHNALIGLLLPAVQRARATVHIVDDRGTILFAKEEQIPDGFTGTFFGLRHTLSVDENGIISDAPLLGAVSSA